MMYVSEITPQMASEMLSKNQNNRKILRRRVLSYKNSIVSGSWMLNGESIKIDKDGSLLDGQHRLAAIIEAGKPIKTYVITDLDREAFKTIDRGKVRTNADMFYMDGINNASGKSSAISLHFKFCLAEKGSRDFHVQQDVSQMIEFYNNNHSLVDDATSIANKISAKVKYPITRISGLYIFLSKFGDVADFFEKMCTPENIPYSHPAFVLRESLHNTDSKGSGSFVPKLYTYGVSAWNAYVEGKSIQRLVYRDDSELPKPKYLK